MSYEQLEDQNRSSVVLRVSEHAKNTIEKQKNKEKEFNEDYERMQQESPGIASQNRFYDKYIGKSGGYSGSLDSYSKTDEPRMSTSDSQKVNSYFKHLVNTSLNGEVEFKISQTHERLMNDDPILLNTERGAVTGSIAILQGRLNPEYYEWSNEKVKKKSDSEVFARVATMGYAIISSQIYAKGVMSGDRDTELAYKTLADIIFDIHTGKWTKDIKSDTPIELIQMKKDLVNEVERFDYLDENNKLVIRVNDIYAMSQDETKNKRLEERQKYANGEIGYEQFKQNMSRLGVSEDGIKKLESGQDVMDLFADKVFGEKEYISYGNKIKDDPMSGLNYMFNLGANLLNREFVIGFGYGFGDAIFGDKTFRNRVNAFSKYMSFDDPEDGKLAYAGNVVYDFVPTAISLAEMFGAYAIGGNFPKVQPLIAPTVVTAQSAAGAYNTGMETIFGDSEFDATDQYLRTAIADFASYTVTQGFSAINDRATIKDVSRKIIKTKDFNADDIRFKLYNATKTGAFGRLLKDTSIDFGGDALLYGGLDYFATDQYLQSERFDKTGAYAQAYQMEIDPTKMYFNRATTMSFSFITTNPETGKPYTNQELFSPDFMQTGIAQYGYKAVKNFAYRGLLRTTMGGSRYGMNKWFKRTVDDGIFETGFYRKMYNDQTVANIRENSSLAAKAWDKVSHLLNQSARYIYPEDTKIAENFFSLNRTAINDVPVKNLYEFLTTGNVIENGKITDIGRARVQVVADVLTDFQAKSQLGAFFLNNLNKIMLSGNYKTLFKNKPFPYAGNPDANIQTTKNKEAFNAMLRATDIKPVDASDMLDPELIAGKLIDIYDGIKDGTKSRSDAMAAILIAFKNNVGISDEKDIMIRTHILAKLSGMNADEVDKYNIAVNKKAEDRTEDEKTLISSYETNIKNNKDVAAAVNLIRNDYVVHEDITLTTANEKEVISGIKSLVAELSSDETNKLTPAHKYGGVYIGVGDVEGTRSLLKKVKESIDDGMSFILYRKGIREAGDYDPYYKAMSEIKRELATLIENSISRGNFQEDDIKNFFDATRNAARTVLDNHIGNIKMYMKDMSRLTGLNPSDKNDVSVPKDIMEARKNLYQKAFESFRIISKVISNYGESMYDSLIKFNEDLKGPMTKFIKDATTSVKNTKGSLSRGGVNLETTYDPIKLLKDDIEKINELIRIKHNTAILENSKAVGIMSLDDYHKATIPSGDTYTDVDNFMKKAWKVLFSSNTEFFMPYMRKKKFNIAGNDLSTRDIYNANKTFTLFSLYTSVSSDGKTKESVIRQFNNLEQRNIITNGLMLSIAKDISVLEGIAGLKKNIQSDTIDKHITSIVSDLENATKDRLQRLISNAKKLGLISGIPDDETGDYKAEVNADNDTYRLELYKGNSRIVINGENFKLSDDGQTSGSDQKIALTEMMNDIGKSGRSSLKVNDPAYLESIKHLSGDNRFVDINNGSSILKTPTKDAIRDVEDELKKNKLSFKDDISILISLATKGVDNESYSDIKNRGILFIKKYIREHAPESYRRLTGQENNLALDVIAHGIYNNISSKKHVTYTLQPKTERFLTNLEVAPTVSSIDYEGRIIQLAIEDPDGKYDKIPAKEMYNKYGIFVTSRYANSATRIYLAIAGTDKDAKIKELVDVVHNYYKDNSEDLPYYKDIVADMQSVIDETDVGTTTDKPKFLKKILDKIVNRTVKEYEKAVDRLSNSDTRPSPKYKDKDNVGYKSGRPEERIGDKIVSEAEAQTIVTGIYQAIGDLAHREGETTFTKQEFDEVLSNAKKSAIASLESRGMKDDESSLAAIDKAISSIEKSSAGIISEVNKMSSGTATTDDVNRFNNYIVGNMNETLKSVLSVDNISNKASSSEKEDIYLKSGTPANKDAKRIDGEHTLLNISEDKAKTFFPSKYKRTLKILKEGYDGLTSLINKKIDTENELIEKLTNIIVFGQHAIAVSDETYMKRFPGAAKRSHRSKTNPAAQLIANEVGTEGNKTSLVFLDMAEEQDGAFYMGINQFRKFQAQNPKMQAGKLAISFGGRSWKIMAQPISQNDNNAITKNLLKSGKFTKEEIDDALIFTGTMMKLDDPSLVMEELDIWEAAITNGNVKGYEITNDKTKKVTSRSVSSEDDKILYEENENFNMYVIRQNGEYEGSQGKKINTNDYIKKSIVDISLHFDPVSKSDESAVMSQISSDMTGFGNYLANKLMPRFKQKLEKVIDSIDIFHSSNKKIDIEVNSIMTKKDEITSSHNPIAEYAVYDGDNGKYRHYTLFNKLFRVKDGKTRACIVTASDSDLAKKKEIYGENAVFAYDIDKKHNPDQLYSPQETDIAIGDGMLLDNVYTKLRKTKSGNIVETDLNEKERSIFSEYNKAVKSVQDGDAIGEDRLYTLLEYLSDDNGVKGSEYENLVYKDPTTEQYYMFLVRPPGIDENSLGMYRIGAIEANSNAVHFNSAVLKTMRADTDGDFSTVLSMPAKEGLNRLREMAIERNWQLPQGYNLNHLIRKYSADVIHKQSVVGDIDMDSDMRSLSNEDQVAFVGKITKAIELAQGYVNFMKSYFNSRDHIVGDIIKNTIEGLYKEKTGQLGSKSGLKSVVTININSKRRNDGMTFVLLGNGNGLSDVSSMNGYGYLKEFNKGNTKFEFDGSKEKRHIASFTTTSGTYVALIKPNKLMPTYEIVSVYKLDNSVRARTQEEVAIQSENYAKAVRLRSPESIENVEEYFDRSLEDANAVKIEGLNGFNIGSTAAVHEVKQKLVDLAKNRGIIFAHGDLHKNPSELIKSYRRLETLITASEYIPIDILEPGTARGGKSVRIGTQAISLPENQEDAKELVRLENEHFETGKQNAAIVSKIVGAFDNEQGYDGYKITPEVYNKIITASSGKKHSMEMASDAVEIIEDIGGVTGLNKIKSLAEKDNKGIPYIFYKSLITVEALYKKTAKMISDGELFKKGIVLDQYTITDADDKEGYLKFTNSLTGNQKYNKTQLLNAVTISDMVDEISNQYNPATMNRKVKSLSTFVENAKRPFRFSLYTKTNKDNLKKKFNDAVNQQLSMMGIKEVTDEDIALALSEIDVKLDYTSAVNDDEMNKAIADVLQSDGIPSQKLLDEEQKALEKKRSAGKSWFLAFSSSGPTNTIKLSNQEVFNRIRKYTNNNYGSSEKKDIPTYEDKVMVGKTEKTTNILTAMIMLQSDESKLVFKSMSTGMTAQLAEKLVKDSKIWIEEHKDNGYLIPGYESDDSFLIRNDAVKEHGINQIDPKLKEINEMLTTNIFVKPCK